MAADARLKTDPRALRAALVERERRKRMLDMKEDAEKDLLSFVRMFWRTVEPQKPFVEGWVADCLADSLMAVTDGHINRLILNVVPGASKSLMLNCFWPAWEWGPCNMPGMRYLSVSYSQALTERDNGRFNRIISDPVYRTCWGDRFKVSKDAVQLIENDKTGWKRALSIGGAVTGLRGTRVLVDDPNNPNEVESKTVRDQTNLWLREVMPDRLNNMDEDAIVLIQQRTHEEDATATLAEHGTGYSWISVPMRFDPLRISRAVLRYEEDGSPMQEWVDPRSLDENGVQLEGLYTDKTTGALKVRMGSPMAKAEGALCWPERFPPDVVDELERIKGPYAFAGQYQQSPSIRGGSIIKRDWWNVWSSETFPELGTVVAALDTAMEEHELADYNALTVWGAFAGPNGEPRLILKDFWQERLPLAQLVARVAEKCRKHKVDYLLIEHKTRGRDVHDEILRLYSDATWQTVLVKVQGDKESRLAAVSHLFSGDVRRDPVSGVDIWSGGMIYAPNTDWAEALINQVASFPNAAHDDGVDSASLALGYMRKAGVVLRKVEYDWAEEEKKKFRPKLQVPYAI